MPNDSEFLWGQVTAVCVGVFFFAAEWLRIRKATKRPFHWAFLEGLRMWGFVAISIASIWLALRSDSATARISYGVLAPVLAALIFNNLHIVLQKRLIKDWPE